MPKKRRLLPNDAAAGEEAALKYFLREDKNIAAAWWFFRLWCADHKPAFSRQLEQLATRVGRAVTHVDGIRVALRFWELSMSDPAFVDQWREKAEQVSKPFRDEWGEMVPLLNRLADVERERLRRLPRTTPEQRELFKKRFRRVTGRDWDDLLESWKKAGLTDEDIFTIMARVSVESDVRETACALIMWAAASADSRIMALADLALSKRAVS